MATTEYRRFLLDEVNAELVKHVGEHLLIGPSHFMRADLSEAALARIWTYHIVPLIEEQFGGAREQIDRWRWAAVRSRDAALLGWAVAPDVAPDGPDLAAGTGADGPD